MKFTTTSAIALGLSVQALATPTNVDRRGSKVQRDLAAFTSVIAAIDSAVNTFASDAKSYSGGDPTTLLSDSESIISVTNSGVSTLEGEADLDTTDAVDLATDVTGLSSDIQTAINNLIADKTTIVAAGYGGTVEDGLQQQLTAAEALASVISAKVPTALAGTADTLASGITDAIESGISAYSGTGSTATSSAGSSATSSTGSSATTSSSGSSVTESSSATSTGLATSASSSSKSAVATKSGTATSSGVVPGSSSTSTGVTPAYTGAANTNTVSGAVGMAAALLAVFAL